jgi:hypothetical protein
MEGANRQQKRAKLESNKLKLQFESSQQQRQ